MDWYVGQEVECITSRFNETCLNQEVCPSKGNVYTIRSLHTYDNLLYIHLKEIINPSYNYHDGPMEMSFNISFFRPLISTKVGMSTFMTILDQVNADKKVDTYNPEFVKMILDEDAKPPIAKFTNISDMLDWLDR